MYIYFARYISILSQNHHGALDVALVNLLGNVQIHKFSMFSQMTKTKTKTIPNRERENLHKKNLQS